MESTRVERMSSSAQAWVQGHKLATIGGVWAAAVGASVAYSRRRKQTRLPVTLAVVGGAAAVARHLYGEDRRRKGDEFDYDFYSQLPAATDADGQENERQSW